MCLSAFLQHYHSATKHYSQCWQNGSEGKGACELELSLIPGTHIVKGEHRVLHSLCFYMHTTLEHACIHHTDNTQQHKLSCFKAPF